MGLRGIGAKALSQRQVRRDPRAWESLDLPNNKRVELFFDELKLTAGRFAGQPFSLRDWQKEITAGIYRGGVRTALITMGRKNGKTGYATGLAAAHLFGPMAEPRGEVYSAASDRNQSGRVFRELEAMILLDSDLRNRCNIQRFAKKIEVLSGPGEGSIYEALSSDAKKAHSLSPSFVICDELAQWPNRELYDNLVTGTGARENPLVVVISTMSSDPNHVMSELVDYGRKVNEGDIEDSSFVAFIYSTPADADIFDERNWYASNPALGDFRSLEQLRTDAAQAKRIPSKEVVFRNLFLNQPVGGESSLITKPEWLKCYDKAKPLIPGEEIFLGLDLSGVRDLCALVAVSANNGDRLKAWFWKPESELKEHARRDGAPYEQWVKQGWIEAPAGKAINYGHVANRIGDISLQFKIVGVAYDRWGMRHLTPEFDRIGLRWRKPDEPDNGGICFYDWGQGFADMGPAVTAWETAIINESLKHDGNPVLTFCVANAIAVKDAAGNRKLDKSATRFRIDGAVAGAMALGLKSRTAKKAPQYQVVFV